MAWNDGATGLKIKFGREAIEQQQPRGEAPGAGEYRTIDVILNLADLTDTVPYVFDDVIVPRNSTIAEVVVENITTRVGGTSLDFGLQKYNGTELDYDGLADGNSQDAVGAKTTYIVGTGGAGALVGTRTTIPGVLTVTPTGTFTAGRVALRARIYVPGADPSPKNFV